MSLQELISLTQCCFSEAAAAQLLHCLAKVRITAASALEKILFPNCYDMSTCVRGVVSVVQWNFVDTSSLTIAYDTQLDACQFRLDGNQLVVPLSGAENEESRYDIYHWHSWGSMPNTMSKAIDSLKGEDDSFAKLILRSFRVYTIHLMLTGACAKKGFTQCFDRRRRDQVLLWNSNLMRLYGSMLGLQDNPLCLSDHAMPFMTELFPNT